MHIFHPSILREYDIRGTVDETITAHDALSIGRSFGTVIVKKFGLNANCSVCYDGRESSPSLESALVDGLISTGVNVVRIGLGPSPMLYFSVHHLNLCAGVMVTGSHNPKNHNGFKFMLGKKSFFGQDLLNLAKIASNGSYEVGSGSIKNISVLESYLEVLINAWEKFSSNINLVCWDPGNGAAGRVTELLTQRLPGRHILLNEKIDGTFPNHHPDPSVEENLYQIRQSIRENNADLGIAFDGDGDRIGVIDSKGRIIWPDQLLAILSREVLSEHPGSKIIADVKCSQALFDEIDRLGGIPLMWKTGHALIKSKLSDEAAFLAGEMSGHIFFADKYFGYDDALYVAVRLLAYLDKVGQDLSIIFDELPKFVNTPEIRFPCPDDEKFKLIEKLKFNLKKSGTIFSDIDGIRVTTDNGWWLLRASNTQPVMVARAEGKDDISLSNLQLQLQDNLKSIGIKLIL